MTILLRSQPPYQFLLGEKIEPKEINELFKGSYKIENFQITVSPN